MTRLCTGVVWIFAVAWLIAVILLLIGTFGWFGQERDPLSGVFLVPLGLPWNLLLDGVPEALKPWGAALAPAINLLILRLVCGFVSR